MSSAAQSLDFGKLLRIHAMVTAAQVAITVAVADALVNAYNDLAGEVRMALGEAGLTDLDAEFQRLFPHLPGSPGSADRYRYESASEASLKLAQIGGWLQGLIDETTFEQRLRYEAEEKARLATKPGTGFGA